MEHDYENEGPQPSWGGPLKLSVEGSIDYDHLLNTLASRFQKDIEARLNDKVDRAISSAAENLVASLLTQKVQRVVNEVIDQGFPQFDEYGRKKDSKPLAEMVRDLLARKERYDNASVVEKLVNDGMRHTIEQEVRKEAARAKEKLASEVDKLVQARIGELLRDALGLG
jgi:hypothetical protein